MISCNIRLNKDFEFSKFIEKAEVVAEAFKAKSFEYEYTTNTERGVYKAKKFNSYKLFVDFFSQNNYRFDSLKINITDEEYVSFSKSSEELGIGGKAKNKDIFNFIINLLNINVLYAYMHNLTDIILSRSNRYRSWERKLGKVPAYIKFYENPRFEGGEVNKYLIDLESVPTHHHLIKTGDKLWFGACAIMYFSEIYYKYIPSEKWDNYNDCEENTVLDNGLRKITLYNNLSDFENPINRARQWAFRNDLGIDIIAHRLISTSKKNDTNASLQTNGFYRSNEGKHYIDWHAGNKNETMTYYFFKFFQNNVVGRFSSQDPKFDINNFLEKNPDYVLKQKGRYEVLDTAIEIIFGEGQFAVQRNFKIISPGLLEDENSQQYSFFENTDNKIT